MKIFRLSSDDKIFRLRLVNIGNSVVLVKKAKVVAIVYKVNCDFGMLGLRIVGLFDKKLYDEV